MVDLDLRILKAKAIEQARKYTDQQRTDVELAYKAIRNQLKNAKLVQSRMLAEIASLLANAQTNDFLEEFHDQSSVIEQLRVQLRDVTKTRNLAWGRIKVGDEWIKCYKSTTSRS